VLKDRLELVQGLGEFRLGRLRIFVLIPQSDDLVAQCCGSG
jgi:hypothetical protein